MRRLSFFLVVMCFGCMDGMRGPARSFTVNITTEDPSGLFVFDLRRDQAAAIEESLVVDTTEKVLRVDEAFLRGAAVGFQHKGKPIPFGQADAAANGNSMRYWVLKRDEREICYYIGTWQQYAGIDRDRLLTGGPRTLST